MSDPAFTDFETRHRLTLNEMQRDAVRTVEGPVLLTAVPGSGKTTVLICRIGYMTEVCGIDPGSILTVTYTKAATADMRRRFLDRFGGVTDAEKVRFATINALCFGVIGEYARTVSKRAPFELLPEDRARGAASEPLDRNAAGIPDAGRAQGAAKADLLRQKQHADRV